MRIHDLFQKFREYSRFHWVNKLSTVVNEYPKCYLLVPWVLFFLFDVFVSSFYPNSYPFRVSLINFLFSTPFTFFLFLYYFPGFKQKADIGFLTVKGIELMIFLTITKFMVFGYRDFSYIHGSNFILIDEILMYLQFGFFALLWWGLREFFRSLQHNFNTELKLIKVQANLDQIKLSPHLLFNSLNNIAGRSSLFSNELFNQVSAFSALLQEAYKKQDVPHFLPDEIAILNHILDLIGYQTERSCIHLHIEHEQDKPLECFKIPRFILGTLMENIIKYGIIDSQEHPAEMNIAIKTDENGDTLLICSTYNLIHPVKKWLSTGHGLVAITNIIKDAFGPDFIFDWVQNQNEFKTLMMLNYGCIKNSTD